MPKWTIRNYNTFLREVRKAHDLSLPQARQAYRNVRDHLHRSAYGSDVRKHPRITRREAEKARRIAKVVPAKVTETTLFRAWETPGKKRRKR